MKNFTKAIGFIIALATTSAQAVPTLYFNGTVGYDASSTRLSVVSDLTGTGDIFPAPALQGSLNFDADLISTFFGSGFNIGNFATISGQDDIRVLDANADVLLTGNFSSLTMSGSDNSDSGTIFGNLTSTGGLLAAEFDIGNVLALQFNFSSTFNSEMFNSNFAGFIDGNIQGQNEVNVAEPSLLALLSMGVLLIGFASKKSRT